MWIIESEENPEGAVLLSPGTHSTSDVEMTISEAPGKLSW